MGAQTLEFQAEVRQLLDLMVRAVYSNRDVFLRELISNASDALDKLQVEALVDKSIPVDRDALEIRLEVDEPNRTLTVVDNGIGMSREEVVDLIGTIAKSGTDEFLRRLQETAETGALQEFIGKFGVGFYSSFMVADRVVLETRRATETRGVRWESTGNGTYTVEEIERPERGTAVTLHLKEPSDELPDYTDRGRLREIVKRYSDFIRYPIRMRVPRAQDPRETEVEQLNSRRALWSRPRQEVPRAELEDFYRHLSRDWQEPLRTIWVQAEGTFEYQALLFVPKSPPFDLFVPEARRGLHLYVRHVFITDDCEELLPAYLRFVKGVVDCQDLPLNLSREMLQQNRQIERIRKRLVRKVIDDLMELRGEDAERFRSFWTGFGPVLKEGLALEGEEESRHRLLELCLFRSTAGGLVTLADYVERMKEGQECLYYLLGESSAALEGSPHLEALRERGVEVLLLTDPVDEYWVGNPLLEYRGKKFRSAREGEVELGTPEERSKAAEERNRRASELEPLMRWLEEKLAEQVKAVRLSSRLIRSPACLVTDEPSLGPSRERLLRAMGQEVPRIKGILELNPSHELVVKLKQRHQQDPEDPFLAEAAHLLYGQAVIAEGGLPEEPQAFARRVADVLVRSL